MIIDSVLVVKVIVKNNSMIFIFMLLSIQKVVSYQMGCRILLIPPTAKPQAHLTAYNQQTCSTAQTTFVLQPKPLY